MSPFAQTGRSVKPFKFIQLTSNNQKDNGADSTVSLRPGDAIFVTLCTLEYTKQKS